MTNVKTEVSPCGNQLSTKVLWHRIGFESKKGKQTWMGQNIVCKEIVPTFLFISLMKLMSDLKGMVMQNPWEEKIKEQAMGRTSPTLAYAAETKCGSTRYWGHQRRAPYLCHKTSLSNKLKGQGAGKERREERKGEGGRVEGASYIQKYLLSTYTWQTVFQVPRTVKSVIVGPESSIRWFHDLDEIVPIMYLQYSQLFLSILIPEKGAFR